MDALIGDLYYQEMFTELSLMRDKMSHGDWEIILLRDGFLYEWSEIGFYFDIPAHSALSRYRSAINYLESIKV